MKVSLDTGGLTSFPDDTGTPSCLLYNSTVRWFDQLKVRPRSSLRILHAIASFHNVLTLYLALYGVTGGEPVIPWGRRLSGLVK